MTHFLEKTLSPQRLKTYQSLAIQDQEKRTFEQLYALNLYYSKELYLILSGLEITIRNSFHRSIAQSVGKDDWFQLGLLREKHQKQLNEAIEYLTRNKKGNYVFSDIIAHLNFGFWVHLCDAPYEQDFWNKALSKCFPFLGRKPYRPDIQRRLNKALILRNKIAHMEPIIKNEDILIQDYRDIVQLLYAVCPKTQEWFSSKCSFETLWNDRYAQI